MERALYVVSVIAMFFVGVAIYFYAQLSWLFVVALAVLMALLMAQAKKFGGQKASQKAEKLV